MLSFILFLLVFDCTTSIQNSNFIPKKDENFDLCFTFGHVVILF